MSKTVLAILSLIIGLAVGAYGGLSLGGGAMMGIGVATGLSSGICATVQAAQEEGIMTAEQADVVLARAAKDLSSKASIPEGDQMVGTATRCDAFMAKLKNAAK